MRAFLIVLFIMIFLLPSCRRNVMELGSQRDNSWTYTFMQLEEPVVRTRCGMAYIGSSKVIIYGGVSSNRNSPIDFQVDDVWEYDVENPSWKRLNRAIALKPRSNIVMTYAGPGKALLYGGVSDYMPPGGSIYDRVYIEHFDTWLYERGSDSWQMLDSGIETINPGVYFGHSMTFIGNNKVLLYGGSVYSELDSAYVSKNQLWEYDLGTNQWRDITQNSEQSPPPSVSAVFEYVGKDQVVFVGERIVESPDEPGDEPPDHPWGRGEWNEPTTEVETWIYNTASNQWSNVTDRSTSVPSGYGTGAYVGDSKMIMYTPLRRGTIPETWEFNADTHTWKNLTTNRSLTPPRRSGHGMTYGGGSKVILFGGQVDNLGMWNDTWQFYAGDLTNLIY